MSQPPDQSRGADQNAATAPPTAKSAYSLASLPIQKPYLTLPPPASTSNTSGPYYSLTPLSFYSLGLGNVFYSTPSKLQYNGYSYQDPFSYQMNQTPAANTAANPPQKQTLLLSHTPRASTPPKEADTLSLHGLAGQQPHQPQQIQYQAQFQLPNAYQGQSLVLAAQSAQPGALQSQGQVPATGPAQFSQQLPLQVIGQRVTFPSGQLPISTQPQPHTSDELFIYFKDLAIFKGKSATRNKYNGKMFIHSKHTKSLKDFHDSKSGHTSPFPLDANGQDSKPYVCTFEGCNWSFARQSDLRRHTKSHKEPMFYCPYWRTDPTCHRNGGSFSRLDVLKRHLRLVHYVKDKQQIFPGSDPGWCRACQKMFQSSKHFIEHCFDCANQISPAEWRSTSAAKDSGEAIDKKPSDSVD